MTIVLHWWILPCALAILGVVLFWVAGRGDPYDGLGQGMLGACCWAGAIFTVVGHFL